MIPTQVMRILDQMNLYSVSGSHRLLILYPDPEDTGD